MAARGYKFNLRAIYFQHEKIKFVSPSGHVMFRLFYVPTYNTTFFLANLPECSSSLEKVSM